MSDRNILTYHSSFRTQLANPHIYTCVIVHGDRERDPELEQARLCL